jgi:endonuclease VIII
MPEGPEIRQSTDALNKVLKAQEVQSLEFGQAHLKTAGRQFRSTTLLAVEPRGKAILTHFSNQKSIYSHNQLYGQWAVFQKNAEPATHKLRRIVITTKNHCAVLYSASDIEVIDTSAVQSHPYVAKLGVELLDPQTSQAQVMTTLERPHWQNKLLAQMLLDQAFLSGVGNYLRSEILFVAGLCPQVRLRDLTLAKKRQLARAALSVTRQAYRTNGITNLLPRAKKLKAAGEQFGVYRHHVFDRDGQACWACNSGITREIIAGRQLYWCRRCQE